MEKDKAEENANNANEDEDIIIIQMRKPDDIVKVYKALENIFGE